METTGRTLFVAGAALAVLSGLLISLNPGAVCRLSAESLAAAPRGYPALCFLFWAYSVPVGVFLAAAGAALHAGLGRGLVWGSLAGSLVVYAAIVIVNDPMPHVPPLFGVGGALILLFSGLILWGVAHARPANPFKLIGYSFLATGLWFTCGMASRPYHDIFDSGQSPIDIMVYFVIAMAALWLGERRASRQRRGAAQGAHGALKSDFA